MGHSHTDRSYYPDDMMDNIAVSSRRQHSSAISRVIIHDDRLSMNNKLIMSVD